MVITWEAIGAISAAIIVLSGAQHWYTTAVVSRAVGAAVGTLRLEIQQVLAKYEAQTARHELLTHELNEIKDWLEDHEQRLRKLEKVPQ